MISSPIRVAAGLVACALALAVAGCSAPAPEPPPRTLTASSLRGKTTAEAYRQLMNPGKSQYPEGLGVVTYDLTHVVAPPDSFRIGDPGDLVVAACYTEEPMPLRVEPMPRIVLGVLPVRSVTQAYRDRAEARGFDDELAECPGTSDTFLVPPG